MTHGRFLKWSRESGITQHAAELLSAENFCGIWKRRPTSFRTNKTRLPSGFWKLYNFYDKRTECPHDGSTGK